MQKTNVEENKGEEEILELGKQDVYISWKDDGQQANIPTPECPVTMLRMTQKYKDGRRKLGGDKYRLG